MKYFIIGGLIILSIFIFVNKKYGEAYKIKGVVYDKSMTSDKHGNVYYHVLVKYDDGEVEEIAGVENYIKFEKGVSYIFTKTRLNFDKK